MTLIIPTSENKRKINLLIEYNENVNANHSNKNTFEEQPRAALEYFKANTQRVLLAQTRSTAYADSERSHC